MRAEEAKVYGARRRRWGAGAARQARVLAF
uniref:Uncharacterized protein n=1 Tax=Arundo donax TaxID=35708 RepID=A0A0A9E5W3_ARUDO